MTTDIQKEATTIGLTIENHGMLTTFSDEKIFHEMMDGYRFAIAYALNKGIKPEKISGKKITTFNVGSLDPKKEIYFTIMALNPDIEKPIYKYAERLAEAGMTELVKIYQANNRLDLSKIIEQST
jgi:hypothetical protein